ncbi:protoglobin domain-containing protein [Viridibacillus arvi]|uniref:protoglobin domain-containing protein n=1 Tax=Viridibacillus arvi TaxID=263475 RepID=UPI0006A96500|nr:protoglobin domain-containing protein [Viridibacillus arvi]
MSFFSRKSKPINTSLEILVSQELNNIVISNSLNRSIYIQMDMIQLTKNDLATLRIMKPTLVKNIESIVAKFYENLEKENSLGKIINQNSSINSLRTALNGHISEMFNGHIDEEFMKKRYTIAFVHAKIGLEPKWYMSAFQDLLNGFFSIVQQTHFNHEEQLKIINFEQLIVLEAHEKHHQEAL